MQPRTVAETKRDVWVFSADTRRRVDQEPIVNHTT